jgi:hypothetical protein
MLQSDSDEDMSGEELPASVADEEEDEEDDDEDEEAGDDDEEEDNEPGSDPEEDEIWKVGPLNLAFNGTWLTCLGYEKQYARRGGRSWYQRYRRFI